MSYKNLEIWKIVRRISIESHEIHAQATKDRSLKKNEVANSNNQNQRIQL